MSYIAYEVFFERFHSGIWVLRCQGPKIVLHVLLVDNYLTLKLEDVLFNFENTLKDWIYFCLTECLKYKSFIVGKI